MKVNLKTKSGAAAIYIVIFTTVLLSVITISFIRIMTSNVGNTVNDDLSISAHDSALAGVEDAKVALVKYHSCIDEGYSASNAASANSCQKLIYNMQKGIEDNSCDVVAISLGRTNPDNPSAVVIQSTSNATDAGDSASMEQAYTCVKITEELTDYRSILTANEPQTVIPLRTKDGAQQNVRALKIMWQTTELESMTALGSGLPQNNNSLIPALVADIFQTASSVNIGQLSAKEAGKPNQVNFASLFLRPSSYAASNKNQITNNISRSSVAGIADKNNNPPFDINCSGASFRCTAIINLPVPTGDSDGGYPANRDASTFFLRLSLPYANASGTEFSVTMCTQDNCAGASGLSNDDVASDKIAPFVGVQALVDSTGRANNVYRRVESRVELVETGFPFPLYALWNPTNSALGKSYWVTNDCYTKQNSDSDFEVCDNYKGM